MNTFLLRIILPDGELYNGEVEYMSYLADDGRVGIMRGALPRVGVVCSGVVAFRSAAVDERFICGDGIIRISQNSVDILTCACRKEDGQEKTVEAAREPDYDYAKVRIVTSVRDAGKSGRGRK